MAAKKHTHKYRKIPYSNGRFIWACALPGCSHFMPPHLAHNVDGKFSICWDCGREFILTGPALEMENPICISCKMGFKGEDAMEILETVKEKLLANSKNNE